MNGEEIIESVQESAAVEGAQVVAAQVAEVVAVTDGIIATEIEALTDSIEEDHEETQELETWLKAQQELLSTRITAVESAVTAQTSVLMNLQTGLEMLQTLMTQIHSSQVSSHSTPPPEPEVPPIPAPENPPNENVEDLPVVETETPVPARRKRRMV